MYSVIATKVPNRKTKSSNSGIYNHHYQYNNQSQRCPPSPSSSIYSANDSSFSGNNTNPSRHQNNSNTKGKSRSLNIYSNNTATDGDGVTSEGTSATADISDSGGSSSPPVVFHTSSSSNSTFYPQTTQNYSSNNTDNKSLYHFRHKNLPSRHHTQQQQHILQSDRPKIISSTSVPSLHQVRSKSMFELDTTAECDSSLDVSDDRLTDVVTSRFNCITTLNNLKLSRSGNDNNNDQESFKKRCKNTYKKNRNNNNKNSRRGSFSSSDPSGHNANNKNKQTSSFISPSCIYPQRQMLLEEVEEWVDTEKNTTNKQNKSLTEHDDTTSEISFTTPSSRWKAMSELAGKHRQDPTVLDLSSRPIITPEAIRFGVPPNVASKILSLKCDGSHFMKGLHEPHLPAFLDVIGSYFPNLIHLYLSEMKKNKSDTDNNLGDNGVSDNNDKEEGEDNIRQQQQPGPTSPERREDRNEGMNDKGLVSSILTPDRKSYKDKSLLQRTKRAEARAEAATKEANRMLRLYILYRLPNLESIDNVIVTEDERKIARPLLPEGYRVKKEEWLQSMKDWEEQQEELKQEIWENAKSMANNSTTSGGSEEGIEMDAWEASPTGGIECTFSQDSNCQSEESGSGVGIQILYDDTTSMEKKKIVAFYSSPTINEDDEDDDEDDEDDDDSEINSPVVATATSFKEITMEKSEGGIEVTANIIYSPTNRRRIQPKPSNYTHQQSENNNDDIEIQIEDFEASTNPIPIVCLNNHDEKRKQEDDTSTTVSDDSSAVPAIQTSLSEDNDSTPVISTAEAAKKSSTSLVSKLSTATLKSRKITLPKHKSSSSSSSKSHNTLQNKSVPLNQHRRPPTCPAPSQQDKSTSNTSIKQKAGRFIPSKKLSNLVVPKSSQSSTRIESNKKDPSMTKKKSSSSGSWRQKRMLLSRRKLLSSSSVSMVDEEDDEDDVNNSEDNFDNVDSKAFDCEEYEDHV